MAYLLTKFCFIGAKNIDNCPAQDLIPTYLIVNGITSLILIFTSIACNACIVALPEENVFHIWLSGIRPLFLGLVGLFHFTWFICGNVWVFRYYEPSYAPSNVPGVRYCDETTYKFAFWLIIMGYIFTVFGYCFHCCSKQYSDQKREQEIMRALHVLRQSDRLQEMQTVNNVILNMYQPSL